MCRGVIAEDSTFCSQCGNHLRGVKGKGSGKKEDERKGKKKDKKDRKDKKKKKDRDEPDAGEYDWYAGEEGNFFEAVVDGETGWDSDHKGGKQQEEEEKKSDDEHKKDKNSFVSFAPKPGRKKAKSGHGDDDDPDDSDD